MRIVLNTRLTRPRPRLNLASLVRGLLRPSDLLKDGPVLDVHLATASFHGTG
jgi:hypothetical protein